MYPIRVVDAHIVTKPWPEIIFLGDEEGAIFTFSTAGFERFISLVMEAQRELHADAEKEKD